MLHQKEEMSTSTACTKCPGLCLVGAGWGIDVQLPAFRYAGFSIAALIGRDAKKTQQIAQKHNIPIASTDLDAVLNEHSSSIDLISIVTPPATHCKYIEIALKHNKHVLGEKPFAMNLQEAKLVTQLIQNKNKEINKKSQPLLLGLIDHELRCLKMLQSAKKNIEKLGKLINIEITVIIETLPVAQTYNWWAEKSQGGGLLGAGLSHIIDMLLFIINSKQNNYNVSAVSGFLYTHCKQKLDSITNAMKDVTSDDYVQAHLKLQEKNESKDNIIPVNISASFTSNSVANRVYHFCGEQGSISINWDTFETVHYPGRDPNTKKLLPPIQLSNAEQHTLPKELSGIIPVSPFTVGTVLLAELLYKELTEPGSKRAEIAAICSSFESELLVQLICDLVQESHEKNGIWIELDQKLLEI